MDHRFSGLSVDILVNNDSGLRTGASIRRLANDYPPLRPLTLGTYARPTDLVPPLHNPTHLPTHSPRKALTI